ncbi:MAG TPA: response regulator transcription factor [Polyangiaceae bacterium]
MLALAFVAAIVADSALARTGLSAILGASPELRVTATLSPAELQSLDPVGLDVIVRDVAEGSSADAALGQTPPDVPVLALVGAPEQARDLVRAGAHGVVSRDASPERLSAASVAVAAGLYAFDEESYERGGSPVATPLDSGLVTPREREVLDLVADGLTNKLIAEHLGISEHTAKFHVRSLMDKLGADTRADLVARAARRGLLVL